MLQMIFMQTFDMTTNTRLESPKQQPIRFLGNASDWRKSFSSSLSRKKGRASLMKKVLMPTGLRGGKSFKALGDPVEVV